MKRESLKLTDSLVEIILKMSEGNLGAARILMDIVKKDKKNIITTILSMDDMNMRGSAIWIGFKDYCKENLDTFIKAVQERDSIMIKDINKEMAYEKDSEKIVVVGGASFNKL